MQNNDSDLSLETPSQSGQTRRPLAERMRPKSLDDVVGQDHILGNGCLLPNLIRENRVSNLLLAGPPGSGKTTLASVIASEGNCKLLKVNAVTSNASDLRETIKLAKYYGSANCFLFVDELHRFNKAQQDLLLPDVESGDVRLIGATTHNPRYYIIDPLLSRCQLISLNPLPAETIELGLKKALTDLNYGLGNRACNASNEIIQQLSILAEGDLRKGYNYLETIVEGLPKKSKITEEHIKGFCLERSIRYDRDEDEHYNTASAYIKSMRGNDPDSAMYWLAKMLAGGEDPRFIARRLVIFASEDVGLADSRALLMADATFRACETIGLPECELNLAHATLFLATCPKSNSSTIAIGKAKQAVREAPVQSVPASIQDRHGRNKNHRDSKDESYLYSHDFPENISGQQYLEKPLNLYEPKISGAELAISERLQKWKILKREILNKKG